MYWLICAPYKDSHRKSMDDLCAKLSACGATAHKFNIPKLKVGTLNQLMSLSDDLQRQDLMLETSVMKIVRFLLDFTDGNQDYLAQITLPKTNNKVTVSEYVENFNWDEYQYPLNSQLRDITTVISQKVVKADDELRTKVSEFNALKTVLNNIDRKAKGSLLVRPLTSVIKPEHMVIGSEYLTTLLVCVPKQSYQDWFSQYEHLGDIEFIVPKSSELVIEDNEYGLFTVTLFKKFVEDFTSACKAKKWLVRDFVFDPEAKDADEDKIEKMKLDRDDRRRKLVRLCESAFSEAFASWTHLKAIRMLTEGIMRYGLPPNFIFAVVKVNSKNEKKVKQTLAQMYDEFGNNNMMSKDESANTFGIEFLPYVFLPFLGDGVKLLGI